MLRLTGLVVDLGRFALRVDSLELASGEYLVVLGPNGAGKTVLLETIAGLHRAKSGRVEFRDVGAGGPAPGAAAATPAGMATATAADGGWADVTAWPPEKRQVGFVYQDYLLFPHLSVSDNIGFGLKGRVPVAGRPARVREAAALTGVEGLLKRRVEGLSGGEQQKVALARACAIQPRLLLLDEPLAALDRTARRDMADEVKGLCRELGVTVLHVTHSLDEAVSLGDRVAVLAAGRLLQVGRPEELFRAPVDKQVAELTGCENLLAGYSDGRSVTISGGPVLALDPDAAGSLSGPVTVALRAEDLVLEAAAASPAGGRANVFAALVRTIEPGPAHWTVKVQYVSSDGSPEPAPGCVLSVFVMPPELARLSLAPGAVVDVSVDPARVILCPA
jgi:molybdate/tungstate transport system ATP-binding protein